MTPRVTHGALDYVELSELGIHPEELLDFSSNLNPFGPPPGVRAALAALDPAPYPDRSCLQLRLALAKQHACGIEALLPGNGANELIHLVARALLASHSVALVVEPTYGEYGAASQLAGATVVPWRTSAAAQRQLEGLDATLERLRPQLTWLCVPNNPTGDDLDATLLVALAQRCAAYGGYVLLDRSYAALRRGGLQEHPLPPLPPNVLQLYSLTKSYALAGLRLGYLLGAGELLERIASYQPTWSVNSAAQAAGLVALGDATFLSDSVPRLWAASDALLAGFRALGLHVRRAALPFMLVESGSGAATRAALLRQGLLVRDCSSFGLPTWVRIAPRQPTANQRLLAAWSKLR
ncbi:pyridoxal phosphate-dependent aminotransferase [Candidatus Viridilinea mediisalina]|uniref:Aminotransferase n=1 Tax=Candidatus Viridilinea mediisalina TaxID=2024553 RepID=A0A2A6RL40_9CHLR|nr:aminotransferase class I/II-fold pyridoxal phosphate-dependent enzyme [Candidatus Viridilinea mediisalina]PDW03834.1 aminotransferase class I/II [Candidatus Viridilinea mediisalina]